MRRFPDNLTQWRQVVTRCFAEGLGEDGPIAHHPFGAGNLRSLPAVIVGPGAEGSYVDYDEGTFSAPELSLTAFIFCGDPNKVESTELGDRFIGRLGNVYDLLYNHQELGQPHDVEFAGVDEPTVAEVGGLKSYTLTVPTRLILPTT